MKKLLLLIFLTTPAYAMDVEEIISKANVASYYQGDDGKAVVDMDIIDSQGRKRNRKFTILRKDVADEGNQKFFVYFTRPADVNKTSFLVHKYVEKDDDRWLYLPALDLVKRIAASDTRTSFVGSNFFYEDVSGRNPKVDNHTLEETTDIYFVIKSVPKDANGVEFSYYKTWIHKATFIPIKTEYYDKKGEKYREYTALKVDDVDGFKTVTKSQMEDLKSGGKTIMGYENVKYNMDLPDDIFSERYLRNPPRKYLR